MALIITVSGSAVAFAREAESGGGSRGGSGRSSTHVEIGDDRGGSRQVGASDDRVGETHRSSDLHASGSNDDGGLRGDGSLDDNHNNRRGGQVSGGSIGNGISTGSASSSPVVIESRIAELLRIVDDLIEQLRRQIDL